MKFSFRLLGRLQIDGIDTKSCELLNWCSKYEIMWGFCVAYWSVVKSYEVFVWLIGASLSWWYRYLSTQPYKPNPVNHVRFWFRLLGLRKNHVRFLFCLFGRLQVDGIDTKSWSQWPFWVWHAAWDCESQFRWAREREWFQYKYNRN